MKPLSSENKLALSLPGVQVWWLHITTASPLPWPDGCVVLFCRSGSLSLLTAELPLQVPTGKQILLLSGRTHLLGLSAKNAQAMAVCVEPSAARETLVHISRALGGLPLGMEHIQAAVPENDGLIEPSSWTDAAFTALDQLPPENYGCYCLLKAMELFHLIDVSGVFLQAQVSYNYQDRYQQDAFRQIYGYIKAHSQEELSIGLLSQRFRLSPTALKQGFRQIYGKTVHSAVTDCRLERAAALLLETELTVLQISQEVGYGSTSHFSAMFRRKYYLSPSDFRKRNKTV